MDIRLTRMPNKELSEERLKSLYDMMQLVPHKYHEYYPDLDDVAKAAGETHDPEAYQFQQDILKTKAARRGKDNKDYQLSVLIEEVPGRLAILVEQGDTGSKNCSRLG